MVDMTSWCSTADKIFAETEEWFLKISHVERLV